MKYSYNWLQKHIEEKLPLPESLKETIIFHAFEVESSEIVGEDTIFDIKVLPDRAGDCLSHYGMAREIAGLLDLKLKETSVAPLPTVPLALPLEIKSDLCRRYIAIQMDGVTIGPSPEWLKSALESVGQRSINNIVDATNYILLDTGQPTHAFDRTKVDGGITVRPAHDGETIITLSEETKTLTPDMLVIADYVGAIAIAGVKGGKTAEITSTVVGASSDSALTSSIILEIANFDPTNVRKTAQALGLQSDAAKRFENNLSPEVAAMAEAQLVALIRSVAGGEVVGVQDSYPAPEDPRTLSFSTADITRLLGDSVDAYAIEDVFDRYRYAYKREDDQFALSVPYWRNDITGAADIAEEVGRVLGYDRITPRPLPFPLSVSHSSVWQAMFSAKLWLITNGYREILTYTFLKNGDVSIVRGLQNKSALRTNLSDALIERYNANRLNAPLLGTDTIKLFEIGTVFFHDRSLGETREEIRVAYVDNGQVTEVTLEAFVTGHTIDTTTASYETGQTQEKFIPWSAYPFIVRDIAVWADTEAAISLLATIVGDFANEYCVRPAVLFDRFAKDGKTSLAYRLVFQASDRTLTETEVEPWLGILVERIGAHDTLHLR